MSNRFDASEVAGPRPDEGMEPSLRTEVLCPPDQDETSVEGREDKIKPNLDPTSGAPRYRRSLFRR
jgi:hypothetical protein